VARLSIVLKITETERHGGIIQKGVLGEGNHAPPQRAAHSATLSTLKSLLSNRALGRYCGSVNDGFGVDLCASQICKHASVPARDSGPPWKPFSQMQRVSGE
jgi:hypothetical protein